LQREARTFLGYFVWKIMILRQKIIFFPIAEGGAKIVGVFRVKNHDYTPKNHIFFQLRRQARKYLGYFVWKIIFFPILGGGGARRVLPPPGSSPELVDS
jgi:hypothetical protein